MHQIFDIALDSDISLPELPEACKVDASIRVQLGTEELRLTLDPIWFHDWKDANDKICMSCGYLENGYLLKFPGFVEFVISGSGNTIYYLPETDIPEETIRHLILDQVVPRVLGQQGRLVLHASAVSLPGRKSVAFLGNSGWGKSTMASSYHENGAYLITDDCLLIDTRESVVQVIPNYYGLRLYADSARAIFGQQDKFSNVAH